MDAADLAGDGRIFKADFTTDGVAELRERLREKLREFMDYADDTLVEYVIVLLKNGRRKDEASKELHVFLGDNSVAFISWLWNHLSSNLHLYVQSQACDQEERKINEVSKEFSGRHKSSEVHLGGKVQTDPEQASESSKTCRNRNKREWKGLVREGNEAFPLRSVLTDILHGDDKKVQKSNEIQQPLSSNTCNGRKRSREDEVQQTKRDSSSHPVIGASRRLLQFAVRDAVKTVQQISSPTEPSSKRLRSSPTEPSPKRLRSSPTEPSPKQLHSSLAEPSPKRRRSSPTEPSSKRLRSSPSEPSSKRLRSVVSTSSTVVVNDKRSRRTRCVLQAPGAALALKAAAEAAADATKVRSSGSVFSRLGEGKGANQPSGVREEKRDHGNFEPDTTLNSNDYDRYGDDGEVAGDLTVLDKETATNVDSASDNDVYGDDGIIRQQVSESPVGPYAASMEKKASMVKCSIALETDAKRTPRLADEEEPACSSPMAPNKTVSSSVNVSALAPPNYEAPRDVHVVEKIDITAKPNVSIPSQSTLAGNVKEFGHADAQKDSQRTSTTVASLYSSTHPTEDADSRTLYVSNVHFAATKDSLSRHFNKFGAVLKVVIVTNAATGQPTGSAYVEFLHKESAERALSLNGTSFMTRILKVVRRSSHEAAHFYGWPGSGRSSLFARHGRMAYPRGVLPGNSFRGGRVPIKAGARSLQWKREPSGTHSGAHTKPDMHMPLSSAEQVLPPTM